MDETSKHAPTPRRTGLGGWDMRDLCATRAVLTHVAIRFIIASAATWNSHTNHAVELDAEILLPAAGMQDCQRVGICERRRKYRVGRG